MIDNTTLKNQITSDLLKIKGTLTTHQPIDVYNESTFVFFNAFVELEQFIIASYIDYALGATSITGFKPIIKINFFQEETLRKFHHKVDKYITIKVIKELYKDMFDDSMVKNPFKNLFETTLYDDFIKMESVRNFIAHKSREARDSFYRHCNGNVPIALKDYLFVRNRPFDIFNKFMQSIIEISESIVSPV